MERRHFHPSLVNLSLAIVYFALFFLFLSPRLESVKVVPCILEGQWSTCTINPIGTHADSLYFGYSALDFIYQIVYLMLHVVIPYILACISMFYYEHMIQRLVG